MHMPYHSFGPTSQCPPSFFFLPVCVSVCMGMVVHLA